MDQTSGEHAAQEQPTQPRAVDQMSINDAVMIQNLANGTRVRLRGGGIAEVTANPQDGQWVYVRFLEYPREPDRVGQEDLVFCTDVVGIL